MIFTIPSVLSPEQVRSLRERLAHSPYEDGGLTASGFAADAKNNLQLNLHQPHAFELSQEIASHLLSHGQFQVAALPVKLSAPMFNLYKEGMYYGPHSDSALLSAPSGPIRGDMSMTIFLSNPDEYEGGELEINDLNSGYHLIKLPAGSAICYPTYAVHQVKPVTRGERWACVLWIQSAIRDPYKRSLLWQLEQTTQMIQSGQTQQALVELSQARNNLLRQWAET